MPCFAISNLLLEAQEFPASNSKITKVNSKIKIVI